MSESFTVTLRNAKQRDADIVVVEPLPRWTDWQVTTRAACRRASATRSTPSSR